MADRFIVPSSPASSAPSTPQRQANPSHDEVPSTTPAGSAPSSAASLTPSGAPSEQFLGSSMMRAISTNKPFSFGSQSHAGPSRNLFGRSDVSSAPPGRSARARDHGPSALSRQLVVDEPDADDNEQEEHEEPELPPHPGNLFRMSAMNPARPHEVAQGQADDIEAELERCIAQDIDAEAEDEQETTPESMSQQDSDPDDIFFNMRHDDRPYGQPIIGQDDEDMIMLNTPAATNKVQREAEDIFRRSYARLGGLSRSQEYQFASIARDYFTQQGPARLTEASELILQTEALVCRLYQEGVGTEDDDDKMDRSLANVTSLLTQLWTDYVETLPQLQDEDFVTVGPSPRTEPFEKAAFVAQLILRIHHTRFDVGPERAPPPPEVLFNWLQTNHNLYSDQIREIARHQPSPASHGLFWQTLRCALLRGDVRGACGLLRNAGWENVRRGPGGELVYTGRALDNIRTCVNATCEMLQKCPAMASNWDIHGSIWTSFRIQAKGALDQLTIFVEGSMQHGAVSLGPNSLSAMAREASSQIPWDIYENLQSVYGIVIGNREALVDTAQDWCEATIGLFGWWDDGDRQAKKAHLSRSLGFGASASGMGRSDDYCERLATVFHLALHSNMTPNSNNPVEVAIASAFEGNVDGVIGCLRTWSLPVATSVAEIASLGHWLPSTPAPMPLSTDALDMQDMALLGIPAPSQDEMEGIKDTTLVLYARELAGIDFLSPQKDGWELAIQVLGRMDVAEKADETVAELLQDIMGTLDVSSGPMVDKMWRILNDLSMGDYARKTAEAFATLLVAKEPRRHGDILWYFALAHRPEEVRNRLGFLIYHSLANSAAFPAEEDLDDELKELLRNRNENLEKRAKQDLEAAQLLGRMLSGYATLRKFYEVRDRDKPEDMSPSKAMAAKKQAAAALVAVISSADDNIRGGLHDASRDAVVDERFLMALLGEASAFVQQSPIAVSLDQIDVLLKAIEDLQSVGERRRCEGDQFFDAVLASGQALKGSTPADLLQKSTNSLSTSSYVLTESSMLASRMHGRSAAEGGIGAASTRRGWDWRRAWMANTKADDVLRKLRLGLAKDLATLWLELADGTPAF